MKLYVAIILAAVFAFSRNDHANDHAKGPKKPPVLHPSPLPTPFPCLSVMCPN